MKLSTVIAAGLFATAISTSASAAGFYDEVHAPGIGRWMVTYQFDQAGSGSIDKWVNFAGFTHDAKTGAYLFGYDYDYLDSTTYFTNVDHVSFVLRQEPGHKHSIGDPNYYEVDWKTMWADVNVEFAKPGVWSVSTTYLGAVPEPATWAMMIVGFGLAGSSLRRHRGFTPRPTQQG